LRIFTTQTSTKTTGNQK